MIINVIFDIFYFFADWFVGVIPEINLPIAASSYISPVANLVGYVDTFVSLSVITLCITTIFIVDNWSFVVKLALKIWELLPFS